MPLHLEPVIRTMQELYSLPIGMDRFQCYLKLLQGDRPGDLTLPIGAYNPMAKPHIAFLLAQINEMSGEEIARDELVRCAAEWCPAEEWMFCINVPDDAEGGWTNRYTTDFDLRFKYQALAKRNMAMIVLWASELVTPELIRKRTREALYRMRYWNQNGIPKTLIQSLQQEAFVLSEGVSYEWSLSPEERLHLDVHGDSEDYAILFSFMFGDEAGQLLGYPSKGFKGCLNRRMET